MKKTFLASAMLIASIAGSVLSSFGQYKVGKHPVEVKAPAICSPCHEDQRGAMNHTGDFIIRHRFYSSQDVERCWACHETSFCADCHANKEEIKPSDKFKDSPERTLPHRGDYITQHRIDGKINPASCIRCHGRRNNERCRPCHK